MPRSPEPSPLPPASERMRVGDCTVDVPLREIQVPGARRPSRVTPKAMGVLRALVDNAGKVVSRDALLAEVWPGTLPTNDVVTQAVTQLRKAFGDERGDPRYIETISKNGYRLLAPVVWLSAAEASPPGDALPSAAEVFLEMGQGGANIAVPTTVTRTTPSITSAAPRTSLRERVLVAGAALGLVVGLLAFLLLRDRGGSVGTDVAADTQRHPSVPDRPYRLITSSPGFELAPTLSPDAAMVAYAATVPDRLGTVIMVQTTDQTVPRPLGNPGKGVSERLPTWSPDGREIAFARRGADDSCQIVVAAANGGGERVVGRCDPKDDLSFDWAPDGRGLIFGSMRRGDKTLGMRILDLASGGWRGLDYDANAADLDHTPRYSPDGRWIVFVRNPQFGDLWRIPAAGGRAERLTAHSGEIRGWDWLPHGEAVVFGRRVESETRLYRLDLATRKVRDLGLDDAQSPDVAAKTGVLAFVRRRPHFGLFRIDRTADNAAPRRVPLFASSARDVQPALAPDGRQLVFGSDRSGHFHLWWAMLDRPDTLRIIDGLHPEGQRMPEWSADSRKLLVVGTDHARRYGIHEVNAASGQVTRLPAPVEDPTQAVYLPNPTRLLVGAPDEKGRPRLILFDRSRSPWQPLASIDDVSLARVDAARNRVLFTRFSGDGLWQADLQLSPGSVRQIDATAPTRWRYRTWAVAEDGTIDYLDQGPDCRARVRRVASEAAAVLPLCLSRNSLSSTTGFSVSARANAIIAALTIADGTDIALMPLPREPAPPVPGWRM